MKAPYYWQFKNGKLIEFEGYLFNEYLYAWDRSLGAYVVYERS